MTTTKIPTSGDPEILPRGRVVRPSHERQTFTTGGLRKPGGPGPLTEERFYEAPDLAELPQWKRARGEEWTDSAFRQVVFDWMIAFFDDRDWPHIWDITEKAGAERSIARLADDKVYLRIGITPTDGARVETSITFPGVRGDDPVGVTARLDLAAQGLDALFAQQ